MVQTEGWAKSHSLDGTNGTDSHVLVPDSLRCKSDNILLRDSANHTLNLSGAHSPSCRNDLASNVFRDSGGAIQTQQKRRLKLSLGPLNLGFRYSPRHPVPFAEREMHKIVDVGEVVADHVGTPESGVGVRSAEAHEGVGQLMLV